MEITTEKFLMVFVRILSGCVCVCECPFDTLSIVQLNQNHGVSFSLLFERRTWFNCAASTAFFEFLSFGIFVENES